MTTASPRLDIVIPVYNEGANIVPTLSALAQNVKTPARVLICYDHDNDNTLPAIDPNRDKFKNLTIEFVKNRGSGVHGAVMTGFAASTAPFVLVFPADDDFNASVIDDMVAKGQAGCDIVCASRFMPGGGMYGCPWLKAALVRASSFTLYYLARLPTHDASNGFRLFSRHAIEQIEIESDQGFCFSIEMLVKCHRLGWRIAEVPVRWFQRKQGESRFRVFKWLPDYLRWYAYGFATTFLRRRAETAPRKRAV
jgi:dolichol-phosphate mannosyltransferase